MRRAHRQRVSSVMLRALIVLVLVGCNSSAPPPPPPPVPPPATAPIVVPTLAQAAPDEAPRSVERATSTWPYRAWDRAEAITFNRGKLQHPVKLRVVDGDGWSPEVATRQPMSLKQARRAAALVEVAGGDFLVSNCPLPRHAVVLYDGDEPVGSANVCFTCGDILVWPAVPEGVGTRPDFGDGWRRFDEYHARTLERWKALFEGELHLPTRWPPRR
jgi:hypothetical protein